MKLPTKRRTKCVAIAGLAVLLIGLTGFEGKVVAAQASYLLDAVIASHGIKDGTHHTVQMIGVVERGGKAEPFRLIATSNDQLRIEYGSAGKDTLVMAKNHVFHDDGAKITYQKAPSGFAQLDITGLFFVEQLRTRAVRVEDSKDQVVVENAPAQRVRVESDRSEVHLGSVRVNDRADLFLDKSGLLAGIARVFYEGRPETYSQAFSFTDYRNTDGVQLPYQIHVFIKAQLRQTFKVDKYQFDIPIDETLFLGRRIK